MNYQEKDTILQLSNVELGYGEGSEYKAVLKDINLTEKDVVREGHITGQVIAVVGRSGRGKSTLFKALTISKDPTCTILLLILTVFLFKSKVNIFLHFP